jgi:hypothetical protein
MDAASHVQRLAKGARGPAGTCAVLRANQRAGNNSELSVPMPRNPSPL